MPEAGDTCWVTDATEVAVRRYDSNEWVRLPAGTGVTVTYAVSNDTIYGRDTFMAPWAFNTTPTTYSITTSATASTNQWAWNYARSTGYATTLRAWDQVWDEVRVTQVQSALQRARASARGAGDMRHEWSVDGWLAQNPDEDAFSDDEASTLTMLYAQSYAWAEEYHLQRAHKERVAAEAERKAETLLVSLLSTEQKREWLAHRHVTEVAPSGRRWRFLPLRSGGALLMDGETNVRRATLCVHPGEAMPDTDTMAALILALRNGDEDHVLQTANVHNGRLDEVEAEIRRRSRAVGQAPGLVHIPPVNAVVYVA